MIHLNTASSMSWEYIAMHDGRKMHIIHYHCNSKNMYFPNHVYHKTIQITMHYCVLHNHMEHMHNVNVHKICQWMPVQYTRTDENLLKLCMCLCVCVIMLDENVLGLYSLWWILNCILGINAAHYGDYPVVFWQAYYDAYIQIHMSM